MRAAVLTVSLCASLACGSARPRGAAEPKPVLQLVQGAGDYILRNNPCGCLADRQELSLEVETPLGWERVALESPDEEQDPDLAAGLMKRFAEAPRAALRVRGILSSEVRTWGDNHASRVLRLVDLDPAPEDTRP